MKIGKAVKEELLSINWKPVIIDGNVTRYDISDKGDIRNRETLHYLETFTFKSTGYKMIGLSYDKHRYLRSIHRLVAEAFIPNPENKPQVNHKNGDKMNNNVNNLEWVTNKENSEHAVEHGLLNIKGTKHPENVYTEDQIRKVCEMLEDPNNTPRMIENATGVKRIIIYHIKKGNTWTHISKDYKFHDKSFNTKLTEEEVHKICKLLENIELTIDDIANITGINKFQIRRLSQKKSFGNILKMYNLPKSRNRSGELNNSSIYTESDIKRVCDLIMENKYSFREISEITGVSKDAVYDLYRHKSWRNISDQYQFPENRNYKIRTHPRKHIQTIIDLINSNLSQEELIKQVSQKLEISEYESKRKIYETRRYYGL